ADLYGDGHSEEILGKTFTGHRKEIIIASKGGTLPHTGFYMPQDFSKEHLTSALELSLKRLKTDYIDLYQLHSPQIIDLEENDVISTLENFIKEGKIMSYGISVRSPQDGIIAIEKYKFPVIQVNFNMLDLRAIESGLFDLAIKTNTGIIARTPFVFGFLTGKLSGNEEFRAGDHRANWPKEQLQRWADSHILFDELNKNKNRTLAQLALQFCLSEKAVSTVIPGMMNSVEVSENVKATEIEQLLSSEIEQIKEIYIGNDFYDKNAKKIEK
ncbi:MAG: aldo/keto reductase, partial [FCB group bacterium]